MFFALAALPLVVSAAGAEKTVWDGVYTAAQATRGKATYSTYCSTCHMDDLSGGGSFGMEEAPPLKRDGFMEGRDLNNVYTFIKGNMPADNPSTLASEAYLDILAYVLQQNGFPAGVEELTPNADQLKSIQIVAKPN
jgi:cytochrome c